jgi:hypothetical protein
MLELSFINKLSNGANAIIVFGKQKSLAKVFQKTAEQSEKKRYICNFKNSAQNHPIIRAINQLRRYFILLFPKRKAKTDNNGASPRRCSLSASGKNRARHDNKILAPNRR